MAVALITGSAGLIGSEAVDSFVARGFDVVGIDNDMRQRFFGDEASTVVAARRARAPARRALPPRRPSTSATPTAVDARCSRGTAPDVTAGDPHRRAAVARLGGARAVHRLRRQRRRHAEPARGHAAALPGGRRSSSPRTNKVYGDTPNRLPLVELETRWEIDPTHPFARRHRRVHVASTRRSTRSSARRKVAADVLVQEYGRYFGMKHRRASAAAA